MPRKLASNPETIKFVDIEITEYQDVSDNWRYEIVYTKDCHNGIRYATMVFPFRLTRSGLNMIAGAIESIAFMAHETGQKFVMAEMRKLIGVEK